MDKDLRQRRHTRQPSSPESSSSPAAQVSQKMDKSLNQRRRRQRWSGHAQWLFFAVASGACAAFNGVFAKLTTTELTTRLSSAIAGFLGISSYEKIVELAIRSIFFFLNLTFNGIMWSLFTTALARGTSATQVSIMNTSTNFLVTAFMGMLVFSEALPPMWWAGASLLVAGSVIAGRKDEGENAPADAAIEGGEEEEEPAGRELQQDVAAAAKYHDDDEDAPDLGNAWR